MTLFMFEDLPIIYVWYLVGVLVVAVVVLFVLLIKQNTRLKVFFTNTKGENWEGSLKTQITELKRVSYRVKDAEEKIKALEAIAQKSAQKIGIVRYNPFKEVGGNQSFSLALLDNQNNGVVLSALFATERSRVYIKPVKNGTSSLSLTEEEKDAIDEAQKVNVPKL